MYQLQKSLQNSLSSSFHTMGSILAHKIWQGFRGGSRRRCRASDSAVQMQAFWGGVFLLLLSFFLEGILGIRFKLIICYNLVDVVCVWNFVQPPLTGHQPRASPRGEASFVFTVSWFIGFMGFQREHHCQKQWLRSTIPIVLPDWCEKGTSVSSRILI